MKDLVFDSVAFEDLAWWIERDRKQALKILKLIQGTGKPEQLKYELSGLWARRIDREHRLVYEVREDNIRIVACRYHY